jgi:hypothetical protein
MQLSCGETTSGTAVAGAISAASIPPQDGVATGHTLPAEFNIEACAAVIKYDLDLKADILPREYEDPEV